MEDPNDNIFKRGDLPNSDTGNWIGYICTSTMMTSSNGNIFPVTGPLCGEFIGHRWIPRTMASDAELWYTFFYPSLNKRLSKQRIHRWFETPSRLLWRQSNGRIITQKAPGFDMGSMSFSEIPRNCAEWHLVSKRKTDIYMIQIILHLDRETWVNI